MRPTNVINEIKNGSTAQLEQVFASYEAQGMPIANNGTTYHLQCRPLDRTNWLGVMAMANLLDSDLDTVTIMTFENVPITLTKPQVLQAMANVGIYSQLYTGLDGQLNKRLATVLRLFKLHSQPLYKTF